MPKRTYKPSKIKRVRTTGFRKWMKTTSGKKILNKKRSKGRHALTPQAS